MDNVVFLVALGVGGAFGYAVGRTHMALCLKGRRRMSPELKQRVLSLPKREPVTGRYMAEFKG